MKKYKVSILGTGSFGTALAYLVGLNQHTVKVFDTNHHSINLFKKNQQIRQLKNISVKDSCLEFLSDTDIIITCIPSIELKNFYHNNQDYIKPKTKIISVSKGLFPDTLQTISQATKKYINPSNFIVLSGPTFAQEILLHYPTSADISSTNPANEKISRELFNHDFFQINFTPNVVASELGGILKNCYAVTLGILHHQKYGMNTKSLAIIHIIQEIKPLFNKLKLPKSSIYSLSFLGDLIATGFNPQSRNFQLGFKLTKTSKTTESLHNIKSILKIARQNHLKLPILSITGQIINNSSPIDKLSHQLNQTLY